MARRGERDNGFSILEMLVAITVISVGLWGIMDLVYRDGQTLKHQEIHLRAVLIGRSLQSLWARTGHFPTNETPSPVPPEAGIGPCPNFTWSIGEMSGAYKGPSLLIFFNDRRVLAVPLFKMEVEP